MTKNWSVLKHNYDEVKAFSEKLNISPLLAALLISRGFETHDKARTFFSPQFSDLHNPHLLKGMDKAVERILAAVEKGEKILIWGDYDVDGTTGTVILRKVLKQLGAETGFHIPNRFTEGYGINIPSLEKAQNNGYTLAISVDCGIRSFDALEWAAQNGLDFIVTDHHLSDEKMGIPPAVSVVNPNQSDCPYPEKNLAGAGVAFKLAHALLLAKGMEATIPEYLTIAALGTVADMMKLTGENRTIVALGLKDVKHSQNLGLRALMEVADCTSEMTSLHIGFRVAPRINAAGRMDVARHVVELFESTDFATARKLAAILDSRNRERQQMQQVITEKAFGEVIKHGEQSFVVVAGENWHRGVIGLAASRIAEKFHRPTIVLSIENGIAQGSARSIRNFHLLDALESCSELFIQFGGHASAAGMSVNVENIDKLRDKLNNYAKSKFAGNDLVPQLHIDAVVKSSTLTLNLVDDLKRMEPFGEGNRKPVFLTKGLQMLGEPLVMKEKHLKFKLVDDNGKQFEAVWWDGVEKSNEQTCKPNNRIEIAYTAEANVWNGNTRLQLVVEDLRADN